MSGDLQGRVDEIRRRVAVACAKAGRDVSSVRIVAVTKTFGPDAVEDAAACGLTVIGESKVQEAKYKIPLCSGSIEWHMIGHLQRNKVKECVPLFRMIHSVDSLRLLETINSSCQATGVTMPVCLEVNVSGEGTKFGMKPDEVIPVLDKCRNFINVDVSGLMTIPPFTPEAEGARRYFRALRDLRDKCSRESGFPLEELSMGMSHDFEIAIEEGATWIRLGSILFGERKTWKAIASEEAGLD